MRASQFFGVLAGTLFLAACGGSSDNSFGGGGTASLSIFATVTSVTVNSQDFAPDPDGPHTVQVTVRFRNATGGAVADGTSVTLSSSDSARGVVSPIDSPNDTASSVNSPTSAGQAQFWFTAGSQTGTVTLTASAVDPASGNTLTATLRMTVDPGVPDNERLTIQGEAKVPANKDGVPIFLGSPFIAELTIRYLGPNGQPGTPLDGQVGVAIAPVSRAAFSTLDDPETEDVNEFFVLLGSGPVNMTAGVATVFVHSFDRPGSATVTVSATDANTGEQFSRDFTIEIEDGAADFLPARLDFSFDDEPLYVQGVGGATTKPMQLNVSDSGGNPVPNPEGSGASWNNVRLMLDAPSGSDARLSGTGAGGPVNGTDISVRSVNGIANFALSSGQEPGLHLIRVEADRADNNVDNGVTDPLVAQTTIRVGDGRLFAVRRVSPPIRSILVNRVADNVMTDFEPVLDPQEGGFVPPNPDGTYSLTVTVVATDQQGNPPLPGANIRFGKIDAPTTDDIPSFFVFSGLAGDPEEAGTLFSVLDGFEGFLDDPLRVDEAVEPGDTVTLFGKSVPGNREHEATRLVGDIVDQNTVIVTEAFNPNDGTGSVVDDGAVIPWVIGRSQVGFVDSNLTLDERGRGTVQLTYPVNSIGDPLVLWSQGDRIEIDRTKTVADVQSLAFPGVAPLTLTVSPNAVRGNTTSTLTLCLEDFLRAPVNGAFITGFVAEGPLTGTLDGLPMPTTTSRATGTAGPGCVETELTTTGMVPDDDEGTITFEIGDAEPVDVTVVAPNAARLIVEPSQVIHASPDILTRQLLLTLLNANDEPIEGVELVGECDGGQGGNLELETAPGVTDAFGQTTATVLIEMAGCGENEFDESFPRFGECRFTTDTERPVGLFTAIGINLRTVGFGGVIISPPPPDPSPFCPPLDVDPVPTTLVVDVIDNRSDPTPPVVVTSEPEGIQCRAEGAAAEEGDACKKLFEEDSVILESPAGTDPIWSADCSVVPGTSRFARADLSGEIEEAACVVRFED